MSYSRRFSASFFCLFSVFILFFISAQPARSDDDTFIWPIRAPKYVSATFGEPRPDRFHMGLDFKSGGAIGKEVYAVGDGHIVRIRTSPFGYGKSLYIKLDSGQTVLYGHLSKFTDEIEEELFNMRIKKGSYDINWYPKAGRFPIKAGSVIARSGDTGGGGAHLHLEIRDKDNAPENPLKYGFTLRDTVKPVLGAVLLVPLDAASAVNGLSRSLMLALDDPAADDVLITGRVGVAVAAYDRANNAKNKLGIYQISMSIDSTEVFTKTYDRLTYSEDRFGGFDHFPGRRTNGNGYLSALYRQPGNSLGIYEGDGVLNSESLAGGERHEITLYSADFMGNDVSRSFNVRYGHVPVITAAEFVSDDSISVAGYYSFGNCESLVIDQVLEDGSYSQFLEIPLDDSSFEEAFELDDTDSADIRIRIIANGNSSRPVYISRPGMAQCGKEPPALTLGTQLLYDKVVVDLTANSPLSTHPVLTVLRDSDPEGTNVPALSRDERSWTSSLAVPRSGRQNFTIMAFAISAGGDTLTCEHIQVVDILEKGVSRTVSTPDSIFTISSNEKSLYRMTSLAVKQAEKRRIRNLVRHSNIYHVNVGDTPLAGPLSVTLDAGDDFPEKAALFISHNGSTNGNGWKFLSADRDSSVFMGAIGGSAYLAILEDRLRPWVAAHSPKPGSAVKSKRPRLRARLEDTGSGIAGSDSIEMTIDGITIYGEYDPEQKWISYVPRNPLKSGSHTVTVKATDKVGNEKSVSWTFSVL